MKLYSNSRLAFSLTILEGAYRHCCIAQLLRKGSAPDSHAAIAALAPMPRTEDQAAATKLQNTASIFFRQQLLTRASLELQIILSA